MILVLLDRCKKPFWEMNLHLQCVVSVRYSCAFKFRNSRW
ncbi:Protein of unknown function [Gryllus bimaculatus]|nr:Protein of unknown function [Gryllus bimaculatus]